MNRNLVSLLKGVCNKRQQDQFVTEISSGKILTYSEFWEIVCKHAGYLKNFGLKEYEKVGLMYRNSLEFMIDFFAILVNQSIVIPLNASLKDRELEYVFKDSNLQYVITENNNRIDNFVNVVKSFYINNNTKLNKIDCPIDEDIRENNLIENTAIILYTSGSTGKAKGVMLSHDNLLYEMRNIIEAHKLTSEDKVLCVLPWFHINGLVITMLTPILAGHEIVIAEKFSQKNFWKWIDEYQITWFSGVPTIYSYLLADETYSRHRSLRFARSASSSLPINVLKEFEKRYHVPVIESYGMTEGGSQLTSNPIPPLKRKPGSVGIPYGVKMRIINDKGEKCNEGESGEVQFLGNSITSGYYKKIQETKDSFEGKWLKTGDIGFIDSDGYLFLNGRIKELINRAGEKFSPKEIEEVLYKYKGIKLVATIGIPNDVYGEEVVAFCVVESNVIFSEKEAIEYCKKNLADYKVPKRIICLDELPVGGNGKIQRLKLVNYFKGGNLIDEKKD